MILAFRPCARTVGTRGSWNGGGPARQQLDRDAQTVTLFSEPEDDDYHRVVWFPSGKPLELPEPSGLELDTSAFH